MDVAKPGTERTVRVKALSWTVGVHALLLLLFLLISYSSPSKDEPVQEMGMEVNLGTDENGSGTDQPMIAEDPAPDRSATASRSAAAEKNDATEVLRTNREDAPVIREASTSRGRNTTRTETNNRNTVSQTHTANNTTAPQRARYVYAGGNGRGGNSAASNAPGTSEGNTTGNGDRGVPGGTPGASNYTGSPGNGSGGISHTLSGRSIVAFPPPDADFKEGGRVIVRVTVNKSGGIVSKQIVSASNGELRNIALKKVDKIKFNKSEDAPEEQFGNITFVFKTRS
ncbi:MAG: energy transducer TonB [Sphingobacteriales bacterium]|nr:MAG: energy transducer TonB [Sphingobacteriales bacterium]